MHSLCRILRLRGFPGCLSHLGSYCIFGEIHLVNMKDGSTVLVHCLHEIMTPFIRHSTVAPGMLLYFRRDSSRQYEGCLYCNSALLSCTSEFTTHHIFLKHLFRGQFFTSAFLALCITTTFLRPFQHQHISWRQKRNST